MKPRTPLPTAALVFALAAVSAPARAETPQQIAESHLKTGVKLFDQGNYEAARLEFLQANAVFARPSLLRNLALCELKTNRPLEAMQHLRAYLADSATTPDKKETAKKSLEEAFAKTGHATIVTTDGAIVSVDGQAQPGAAPFADPIDTLPGHHVLEARLGERKASKEVDLPAGTVATVELRLTEGAPAVPAPQTTAPRQETMPPPEPKPSFWTTKHTVGVVGIGLAAVAAGITAGFLVAREGHVSDGKDALAEGPNPSPANRAKYESARDGVDSATTGIVAFGITTGVLAVVGTVLLLWPEEKRAAALRVLPFGRDLSLVGTF